MTQLCSLLAISSLLPAALLAQTVSDSFDDNSRDTANWEAPVIYVGNGQLLEQNGRLEFSAESSPENSVTQTLKHYPSYQEAWQVQMVVSVDPSQFSSEGQDGSLGIGIGNTTLGNDFIDVGLGAGVLPGVTERQAIFSSGFDDSRESPLETVEVRSLPTAITIRATYDPQRRIIRSYYDLDTDLSDGEWTLFKAYTINGTDPDGAGGVIPLDWGMTDFDAFWLEIDAHSDHAAITGGSAWVDDFGYHRGSTVQSEFGLRLIDDFDDDSRDAGWDEPYVELGTPELVEESSRLEFRVDSASGEQETWQLVGEAYWPRFDQAFEVQLEAHCLPSAMFSQDQVGGVDLLIANDAGDGDVFLSVAAIFDAGERKQVRAVDNSEVDPLNDWPESIEFGDLPEVVGIRAVWEPDTRILSCYFDTDGDRTVETWELFTDYTLGGSSQGTAHTADWQMAPTDRFRIGLNGYAQSTRIDLGEAYFENFSLVNAPMATGYPLWSSAIPDAGMRGTTDDASGNGIPNLLQYMYGLEPMATDTDVQLKIQMENGHPVLLHGLNESATDYTIGYQAKVSLEDPQWIWASEGDATSIETFDSGGKTFRKITFPLNPSDTFIQLVVMPLP